MITGLSSGGAERALYNILAGGLAKQFDSVVVSLRDGGVYASRLRALGVPVYELGMRSGLPRPATIARLRTLVRQHRPDLIQGWMYHGNLAASLAAILAPGQPAVAWNVRQSLYQLSAEKPLTRQVIRGNRLLSSRPHAILYNSRLSREQHEAFGFSSTMGRVIANGFDTEALAPTSEQRAAARKLVGIDEESDVVVGHVARFHPMKDHAGFLRAALRVLKHRPGTRFLLLGRDVSLENPALAGIVPDALTERFIFLGERSDVHQLMQTMDILCMSSAWGEAFPNVLGEAMASGVPCVATDVGDSAHIVGDTGRIAPASQPDALAEALLDLLALSATERDELGRAARKRIEARYALPAIVSQYAEMYNQLVQEKQ